MTMNDGIIQSARKNGVQPRDARAKIRNFPPQPEPSRRGEAGRSQHGPRSDRLRFGEAFQRRHAMPRTTEQRHDGKPAHTGTR
ncbi:hypothetical protein ACQW02_10015 [Humitalea sp. 24SJ18S-53]|uniref:hypothetical protein n=1 Tax=Humitalea sp. 24SJ18S-53 TaxID=3422307 RepID=UPI003D67DAE9